MDIPRQDGSGARDPRNLHPEGKVHALEHDGDLVTESAAIMLTKERHQTDYTGRMSGWLALNGTTEIRGSRGEISGAHVSEATTLWLQTMVSLTAGDTLELLGNFRAADGYFAADQTSFWGTKVG